MAKLPSVVSSIPQDLKAFINQVREALDGRNGNRLVTVNDLVNSGLTVPGPGDLLIPPSGLVDAPITPTNVQASGAIRNIIVTWDAPLYYGHAYAEIWGSSTNNIGVAVKIGMSPGSIFVDPVGPSVLRYYWVRFVNNLGAIGAFNAVAGTFAETGPEVDFLLETLASQITASQLATSLNNRINLIDGPATTIGTIPNQLALVQGQLDAINSYPDYDNATTYATNDIVKYDGGLYKALSATTGNLPTNTTYWLKIGDYSSLADIVASHTSEISIINTGLSGEITTRETLATQMRGSYNGTDLSSVTSGLIFSERTARADADVGLAGTISVVAATAAGKNRIYRQPTAPSTPTLNDIWVDTKVSYNPDYFSEEYAAPRFKQFQWNGTEWLDITDTDISDNFAFVTREQLARATADSALAQDILTLNTFVDTENATLRADLLIERNARIENDEATVELFEQLDAQVNNPTTGLPATRAVLINDYYTSATVDSAIAQSGNYLRAYADIQSKVFRTADAPTKRGVDPETAADVPLEVGDVWYDTNDGNKLYLWSGTAWVYSPDAVITGSVTAVDSRVTTVETTQIGYCTIGGIASDNTNKTSCQAAGGVWNVGIPLATAVKQVSVSDGADSATLEQRFTAQKTLNDGLKAQYTIKLDVNGNVAGFGVFADSTGSSEFIANVNRFAVTTPQSSIQIRATSTTYAQAAIVRVVGQDSKTLVCKIGGTTGTASLTLGAIGTLIVDGSVTWQVASRVPFAVQAVPTNINGQSVPAGVYIDAAYVLNATIQNAQIADLAVDDTKIANLSVGKLTAGSINVDDYIQSTAFISGNQGWRIHGNGFAEFGAAAIRGQLTAAQIDSRGLSIKDASGNIILAAGSPLSTSNISGLGGYAFLSTITSANISTYIASAAIGTAYISDLNATKLTSGSITVGTTISGNYSPGSTGWYIDGSGNAEFNQITVRSGQVTGALLKATGVPLFYSARSYVINSNVTSDASAVYIRYIVDGVNVYVPHIPVWTGTVPAPETAAHRIAGTVSAGALNNSGGTSKDFSVMLVVPYSVAFETFVDQGGNTRTARVLQFGSDIIANNGVSAPFSFAVSVTGATAGTYSTAQDAAILVGGFNANNTVGNVSGLFWGVR